MSSLMRAEERLNNAIIRLESLAMNRTASPSVAHAGDDILATLRKENTRLRDSQEQAKKRLDKLIINLESHGEQS